MKRVAGNVTVWGNFKSMQTHRLGPFQTRAAEYGCSTTHVGEYLDTISYCSFAYSAFAIRRSLLDAHYLLGQRNCQFVITGIPVDRASGEDRAPRSPSSGLRDNRTHESLSSANEFVVSRWGCRGRRLSREQGSPDRRCGPWLHRFGGNRHGRREGERRKQRIVSNDGAVIDEFLEFSGRFFALVKGEVGLAADVGRVQPDRGPAIQEGT
jgi:hypothetical protein